MQLYLSSSAFHQVLYHSSRSRECKALILDLLFRPRFSSQWSPVTCSWSRPRHWWSLIIIDDHWLSLIIIDYHWWSMIIIEEKNGTWLVLTLPKLAKADFLWILENCVLKFPSKLIHKRERLQKWQYICHKKAATINIRSLLV